MADEDDNLPEEAHDGFVATDEGLPCPINQLHPNMPEIINFQASMNIGTIGHVAHGKTTLVKAISTISTIKFSDEKKNNRTIKLGYANAKIFKCDNPLCPAPGCYKSFKSSKNDAICDREGCGGVLRLIRHISFVDCPGHDDLMATMLNGASVMDAVILVIPSNESCPQPQTQEHMAAIEMLKVKNILVVQNKIDLVTRDTARQEYAKIKDFLNKPYAHVPIIPVSAQLKINTDIVVQYIVTHFPVPVRDFQSPPRLIVVRSFDVNKPGYKVDQLVGGVAGGSLQCGVLKLGMEIEMRPGYIDQADRKKVHILRTRVVSLHTEENSLTFAVPGGLIGVGTDLDPSLCKNNMLVGQVLGIPGQLPPVYIAIEIEFHLLYRLVGVKSAADADIKVEEIVKDELLKVNIGAHTIAGTVLKVKGNLCKLTLVSPVCARIDERIALSRRVANTWRLIGHGILRRGKRLKQEK